MELIEINVTLAVSSFASGNNKSNRTPRSGPANYGRKRNNFRRAKVSNRFARGGAWVEDSSDEDDAVDSVAPASVEPSKPTLTPAIELGGHEAKPDLPVYHKLQATSDITVEPALLANDAPRFHEASYRATILQLAQAHIAAEAPITYKRICDLIAREHGFKRTGGQISSSIWEAIRKIPNSTRLSDGHTVYWPADTQPRNIVPFRGLQFGERDRLWKEVPLPERLGLVSALKRKNPLDLPRSVAEEIGYSRLTQSFRYEIAELERLLEKTSNH